MIMIAVVQTWWVIIADSVPDDSIADKTYTLTLVEYVLIVIKVILDVYIVLTFAELSREFLEIKLNQLDNRITKTNKFIILWLFFVIFLHLIMALCYLLYNRYLRF